MNIKNITIIKIQYVTIYKRLEYESNAHFSWLYYECNKKIRKEKNFATRKILQLIRDKRTNIDKIDMEMAMTK